MMEWFNALITWVSANPTWAGVLVFLVAFSESLAIIGMIVPGVVMMFAAGALVGAGVVDFWPIYFAAFAGAVLGDALSFYLGARYREDLCNMWPFSKHTELLDQGVVYFKRWGGKSVAIGRFFGPVRAVIPLVAGMLQMQVGRYLVANILSAIGWAFAYLLPGIAIGASLELASQVAFHLVVLMLSLVAILWLSLWLLHRLFIWIQPLANCWLQLLLAFSEGDSLPRRIAAALADPQHPESKGLSIMAAFIFISVFALALLMTLVFGDTGFGVLDQYIHNATSALRYPTGDSIMVLITTLGDGWLLGWLSATVFILLFIQHRPTAWHWLAAVVFAFAAPWLLKAGLQVARPPNAALTNWSFPSGHAVHATVIYGFLAVLLATRLPQERRWLVYAVTIVLVLLIGFSRLYLGVHWFSDVIAGWVLGLLWISVLGLAWRHH
ncbi:bifunctional DedA family/phosphatase PAP2 family protein, partial [Solemya velum gill symbiont]